MKQSRIHTRRVAVVTGTRAEFGLLEPVLQAMKACRALETRLIVTGMHLLPKFGHTVNHIRKAGWRIDASIPMQTGRDDMTEQARALARGIDGIAGALEHHQCEIVVVLGDRIEAFAGACAATVGRRILAHIHGGDQGTGDIDDSLRNAITRLAHIHFVATEDARQRLLRMGEPPARIHRVGAPGLDNIRQFREWLRHERRNADRRLRELIGSVALLPYALMIQHPSGDSRQRELLTTRNMIKAVNRCGLAGVAIYPNSDPGHEGIVQALLETQRNPQWRIFRSLPRDDYLLLASQAATLVGNSSSGIIESASLGVPAVNIGDRQRGRLRCGPGVVDSGESIMAIERAIRLAIRRPRPQREKTPYGDGQAGKRIARVCERLIIDISLRRKHLSY